MASTAVISRTVCVNPTDKQHAVDAVHSLAGANIQREERYCLRVTSTTNFDAELREIQQEQFPDLKSMVRLNNVELTQHEASQLIGRHGKTIKWLLFRVKEALNNAKFIPHPTIAPNLTRLDGTQTVYLKPDHGLSPQECEVYAATIHKWQVGGF